MTPCQHRRTLIDFGGDLRMDVFFKDIPFSKWLPINGITKAGLVQVAYGKEVRSISKKRCCAFHGDRELGLERFNQDNLPLDDLQLGEDCDCEFTPDDGDPTFWVNYLRRCPQCSELVWSLHCPHDGIQSRCACGARLTQIKEKT